MAGRGHVGAFLVHWTCCVCRKVLVSSSTSKYTVIAHIVTTVICIYLYFISPIFIYLTYHFIQRNTCFNLLCVLSLWCTVLWILIACFIWCTCQKWRNKDVQSINQLEHRLSALPQLHLHYLLNTWLKRIGHRQLQEEMRNFYVLEFGAPYIRDFYGTCVFSRVIYMKRACVVWWYGSAWRSFLHLNGSQGSRGYREFFNHQDA